MGVATGRGGLGARLPGGLGLLSHYLAGDLG